MQIVSLGSNVPNRNPLVLNKNASLNNENEVNIRKEIINSKNELANTATKPKIRHLTRAVIEL